jgi:glutamyl-tRNA reductase
VAPAIVGLQRRAEEMRIAEIRRVETRLGTLTGEQIAAVEVLTRGLVNKFLHPTMQALKQAAREGDVARIEAIRETYSLNEAEVVGDSAGPALDKPEPVVENVEVGL